MTSSTSKPDGRSAATRSRQRLGHRLRRVARDGVGVATLSYLP